MSTTSPGATVGAGLRFGAHAILARRARPTGQVGFAFFAIRVVHPSLRGGRSFAFVGAGPVALIFHATSFRVGHAADIRGTGGGAGRGDQTARVGGTRADGGQRGRGGTRQCRTGGDVAVATSGFVVGGAGTARAVQGRGGGFQRPRVPCRVGRAHGAQGRQAAAGQRRAPGLVRAGGVATDHVAAKTVGRGGVAGGVAIPTVGDVAVHATGDGVGLVFDEDLLNERGLLRARHGGQTTGAQGIGFVPAFTGGDGLDAVGGCLAIGTDVTLGTTAPAGGGVDPVGVAGGGTTVLAGIAVGAVGAGGQLAD